MLVDVWSGLMVLDAIFFAWSSDNKGSVSSLACELEVNLNLKTFRIIEMSMLGFGIWSGLTLVQFQKNNLAVNKLDNYPGDNS